LFEYTRFRSDAITGRGIKPNQELGAGVILAVLALIHVIGTSTGDEQHSVFEAAAARRRNGPSSG